MKIKHFLSLQDMSIDEILAITHHALSIKLYVKDSLDYHPLKGKILAMIFEKASTRTRVSFEVAMHQLGGKGIFLSADDIQLSRGESIADSIKVLERFCDFVVVRTFAQESLEQFATHAGIPVINGLSDRYHPTQLIADLITMIDHQKIEFDFMQKSIAKGSTIAYIGDGNNMANSWAILCSKLGLSLNIASPKGYEVDSAIKQLVEQNVKTSKAQITFSHDPKSAIKGAGVVVTDTWTSMGSEDEKAKRQKAFKGFTIDKALFALADKEAIFMHCLPAYRGQEVSSEVIDGEHSVVFDEAENRLHANKGILVWLHDKQNPQD